MGRINVLSNKSKKEKIYEAKASKITNINTKLNH